jgi:hypothetical protein
MTIAEEIRMEERQITSENITFNFIKGLWEDGQKVDYIAKVFKLPVKKVQDIIQKIIESKN